MKEFLKNLDRAKLSALFFCLISFCSYAQVVATPAPETKAWDWQEATELLEKAGLWSEQESLAFSSQHDWQTNGVVIIKNDRIIYERYANGLSKDKPHRVWSISKSFTSALVGIRYEQLAKDLNEPVYSLLDALEDPLKKTISMVHLLQMSSGLAWNEFYEKNPFQSHVVDMLYINNYKDMGLFTAKRPMRAQPGQHFNYSSGESNLIMRLLQASFGSDENAMDTYQKFPWEHIFEPIGITSATWEQDLKDVFVGSSYLYLNARDLARFGRLYLNLGLWPESNKQVVPQSFVKDSLRMAPAVCQTLKAGLQDSYGYGYHWWLNRECPNKKKRIYPELPQDVFMALGHHGQMLVIIPSEKAIIVRLAADKKKRFPKEKWLALLYSTLKGLPKQEVSL